MLYITYYILNIICYILNIIFYRLYVVFYHIYFIVYISYLILYYILYLSQVLYEVYCQLFLIWLYSSCTYIMILYIYRWYILRIAFSIYTYYTHYVIYCIYCMWWLHYMYYFIYCIHIIFYLSIYLSINLSIYLPIYLSIYLSYWYKFIIHLIQLYTFVYSVLPIKVSMVGCFSSNFAVSLACTPFFVRHGLPLSLRTRSQPTKLWPLGMQKRVVPVYCLESALLPICKGGVP